MKAENKILNVFILSSGRSGSTLLSNILNAHSKVLSVPESTFLITLSSLYKNKTRFKNADYQRIINLIWLRKSELKSLWNIDHEKLLTTLQQEKPQSLKLIYQLIYQSYNGSGAKKPFVITDKNPLYFQFIHQIKKTYPKAKYIILVRDYRDRYTSILENKKKMTKNLVRGISWNSRNKALFKMHLNAQKKSTLLIRYEDLVLNPEKETQNICQFLNILYEPKMLKFYKNNPHDYSSIKSSKDLKDHITKLHQKSNSKIRTDKIDVWRTKLDKKTISILETYCGKTGELLGYKKSIKNTVFNDFTNRAQLSPNIALGRIIRFLKVKSYSIPYFIQKKAIELLKF